MARFAQIFRRSVHSSTTPSFHLSATAAAAPASDAPSQLDVRDTERLFAAAPTSALVRSLSLLSTMAVDPLVDLGIRAARSEAATRSRAARAAVAAAARATVYGQFCAGATATEAAVTLRELWGAGLRGILDYGLEDAVDGAACDRNLEGFLDTVEMIPSLPADSVSFACVKITAICPVSLLERVSDQLRWQQKDASFPLPWKSHSLPVLSKSSVLYHTSSVPRPLSSDEEDELKLSQRRLTALCRRCADLNLPLLVDAEYTSVQPAIDYLTYSAALEFNREILPIVYVTIQSYLKDSKDRLVQAVEAAERMGIPIGFKLVRGAYLTRESRVAASLGAASPIHATIHQTHTCYNECACFMLDQIAKGFGAVMLATHNLDSGKVAAAKADELGIRKGDRRLQFAQLKGMADALSLGLRNAGFLVSKYLPFGPVEQVIPYLIRRAEENRGLLSASTLDRQLIRAELKRRFRTAIVGKV